MKKKYIIGGIILLLNAIFFFPVKTVRTISGPGEILNRGKAICSYVYSDKPFDFLREHDFD